MAVGVEHDRDRGVPEQVLDDGNTTYNSGSVPNAWGYAGGYTDSTGLIKFGARYYDPTTGRWTQTDLVGAPYEYAGDNPINNSDPSGYVWFHLGGIWWSGY